MRLRSSSTSRSRLRQDALSASSSACFRARSLRACAFSRTCAGMVLVSPQPGYRRHLDHQPAVSADAQHPGYAVPSAAPMRHSSAAIPRASADYNRSPMREQSMGTRGIGRTMLTAGPQGRSEGLSQVRLGSSRETHRPEALPPQPHGSRGYEFGDGRGLRRTRKPKEACLRRAIAL